MKKKVITKRKIKIVAVVLLLLIVLLVYFLVKLLLSIRIQNIFIKNNKYLSDDYIIEKAGLMDYPSYFKTFTFSVSNKLEEDDFIKTASVKKQFFGVINIDVEENNVLFFREHDQKYVLEDKTEVSELPYEISITRLVNYIPDTIYDNFVTKYSKIDEEVRNKISQIKYDPSDYDNSRFLFYMVDGNYVYVTLTKLDSINYYSKIYSNIGKKKGILYLDSGNHFQELK